jgi:uncharacterized protein (TIGR00369 family)
VKLDISMDNFEFLRAQLVEAVPFAKHAGVEIIEIADGFAVAQLIQAEQLSNHLGSVHAGAIFTLGETASGAAMIGAFAQMATMIRPVATSAKISYLKLGRGTIKARARADTPSAELRHQLTANGLVTFEINVDVQDARERVIAQLVVPWRVSMPKRASN